MRSTFHNPFLSFWRAYARHLLLLWSKRKPYFKDYDWDMYLHKINRQLFWYMQLILLRKCILKSTIQRKNNQSPRICFPPCCWEYMRLGSYIVKVEINHYSISTTLQYRTGRRQTVRHTSNFLLHSSLKRERVKKISFLWHNILTKSIDQTSQFLYNHQLIVYFFNRSRCFGYFLMLKLKEFFRLATKNH